MERDPWFRALLVLAVVALVIHLAGQFWGMAQHFFDIILVFFLAWLIAFILGPLASFLQGRLALPRSLAAALVYLALLLNIGIVFVLVVPLAVGQLVQLGQRFPLMVADLQDWLQGWMAFLQAELQARGYSVDLTTLYKSSDIATQLGGFGSGLVTNTIGLVGGIASAVFNIILVLILSFYLVLDGERLAKRVISLVPADRREGARFFLDSINRTFGGWLRGTLLVALAYAVGNALVMSIAGLGYVLIATLLAAGLMIIPLFGPVLAMVMPVILALIQGDLTALVVVVVGLLILQVAVLNILSPKVMGESMGMHPLLVFLALLLGIKQAGFVGAVFGVPIIGVTYAMAVYFIERRAPRPAATPPSRSGRPPGDLPGGIARRRVSLQTAIDGARSALGRKVKARGS